MLRRSLLFLVVCFVIGGIFVGTGVARGGDIRQKLLVAVKASPGSFALDGKYHYRTLGFKNVEADYREARVERGTVEFNSANHTWAATYFDYNSQGDSGSGSNSGTYSVNPVDGSYEQSIPTHEGTVYGHGYISNGNKTLIMSLGEMYEQTIFIAVKDEGRTFNKSDLCGAYKFRDLEVHDFEKDHGDAGVGSVTLSFDGQGNWNGNGTYFESDGSLELIAVSGTYTVSSDGSVDFYEGDIEPNCTGHLSGDTNSLILGKGRQNSTISQWIGVAVKVDPATIHTNSDLSGIYHYQMIVLQDFETDDREAEINRGAVNFDGAGNFTGTFKNYDSDNTSESGSITGTYSVNSDGSFISIVDTSTGSHETWSGNISSDGNIITMAPSQAITGDWVSINGDITTQDGTSVCAMVLANGQYMFSCNPTGKYNLSVPLNENGQITLFAFADGFAPFKYIFTPEGTSENIDIMMLPAPPDSPQMTLTCQFDTAENLGWVRISGQAGAEDGGTPLCAMVLANGQYMFSNAGTGEYELEVPLDENGQVTLFGFADGFQPFKQILEAGNVTIGTDHTASGTYTYDPGTGTLTLNTTSSDFECEGPEIGTEQITVSSISSTTMIWDEEDPEGQMTWTRDSGTRGDIVGIWESSDDETGNSWAATFELNGSFSVVGSIVQCENGGGEDGNSGDISMITPYVNETDMTRVDPFSSSNNSPWGRAHDGIDFHATGNFKPFQAVCSGVVDDVILWQNNINWQVNVRIIYNSTYSVEYAFEPMTNVQSDGETQLANISVSDGQTVSQGDTIGYLCTAHEEYAHVHFGLHKNWVAICPEPYFTPEARNSILGLIHKDHPDWNMCY